MASVEVNQMLSSAAAAADDKKAEDIRILALDPAESGLADYFLICTGTNDRQTVAIADEIELRLKRDFNTYPNSVEGRRQGEWVLMDYVDLIVHIFLPEKRAFYGLERLRKSATTLSVADLNQEIKTAIAAHRPAAKKTAATKTAAKAPARIATAKKTAGVTKKAAKTSASESTTKKAAAKKVAKKAAPTKASSKRAARKSSK